MIVTRVPSIERAVSDGLGLTKGRALVVRAVRIELTLPPGIVEAAPGEDVDALVAAIDATTIDAAASQLGALAGGKALAWVMPVARAGVLGWAFARARRLGPVVLEDVCDTLRRAGVIDVRVAEIDGRLPLVLVSGRTTAA